MRHSYRGFTSFNMSAPRVRQMFVFLILGTAVIFVVTGLFAMLQAERSAHPSELRKITSHFSTETLLYLMGGEIPYLAEDSRIARDQPGFSRIFFELVTSVDPKDPRSFLGSELPGFALFDTEIVVAGENVDYTAVPIESPPPDDLEKQLASKKEDREDRKEAKEEQPEKEPRNAKEEPEKRKPASTGKKKVFIYHTHFTESYLPELKGTDHPNRAYDNEKNITLVGKRLGEELERLGIGAQVRTEGFDAGWNELYRASRSAVAQAMKQNKDLTYFIDIHRDAQRRNKTTKVINGTPYARLAFVIGTANPHWEENERFARQLHNRLDELYPGLSKGVFRKSKATGNGEYNQSLSKNSILVEVGGVDNTMEEAYRTSEALARALADLHFEATPVDARPR